MALDDNIGRLIFNRYRLADVAGVGAMGKVYRGIDVRLIRVVAVKFLDQRLQTPRMCERFETEARICAQLGQRSLQIVKVEDYGLDERDVPFYVMEYLQGKSLKEILAGQPLPLVRFLKLARQICLGLQCAHEGIQLERDAALYPVIHRDIKPGNIMVMPDPTLGELVKILDFGISELRRDTEQAASYMGTLAYSSPEQMEGVFLDGRSDIYSLGVLMFEMLTGKLPLYPEAHNFPSWYKAHHEKSPRPFRVANPNVAVPQPLQALILDCLAKSPDRRPQSMSAILRVLEPLAEHYGATQSSPPSPDLLNLSLPELPLTAQENPSDISRLPKWTQAPGMIVYAQPWTDQERTVPSKWVMLPHHEIQTLQIYKLYNQLYLNFLCCMSPSPMLLWVTAVHNPRQKTRWLRKFLDLKKSVDRQLVHLLIQSEQYPIFFFDLEPPHCFSHQIDMILKPEQRSQLQQWMITSQSQVVVGIPDASKTILRTEYERLKPKVESQLERQPW